MPADQGSETGAGASRPSGQMPDWMEEILAAETVGFYEKLGTHAACYMERSTDQLVISFDNLSDAGNPNYDPPPWAGKFLHGHGWSHLGVFAPGPSWYRDPALIAMFARLASEGFFKRFARVALVGTSMGGFAALAFADFAPGATVVALSPQSTVDPALVPWEERFLKGQRQDWSLPFSDAAHTLGQVSQAYVLYDPWVTADKRHVDRLPQDRLIHLRAHWFGHKSAVVLRRIDKLKPVMEGAIRGTLTPTQFYAMVRERKDLLLYRRAVEAELERRGQQERLLRFRDAFRARRREQQVPQ